MVDKNINKKEDNAILGDKNNLDIDDNEINTDAENSQF